MKDRSQLDDMRAALRGDLERARERRGETLLDREPEPEPEPEPQAEVSDTHEETSDVVVPVSDTLEPEPEPEPEPRADAEAPLALVPARLALALDPGRLERRLEVREVLHADDAPVADRHDRRVALDAELPP